MPIVAAIPAVIGAGASIYAANQANKGIQKGIDTQTQASREALAQQEAMYNQTRTDQAPFRQAGYAGIDAILQQYGLTSGGGAGVSGANDGNPYDEYEAANPDLAAEARRVVGTDPRFPTTEAYYRWHDANYPQEARSSFVDTAQPQTQPDTGERQLTGEQQLQMQVGQEPTFRSREAYTRPGFVAPKVGLDDFQASPDYQFRLNEGSRNLNAFNAARGVTGSGAAAKALVDYGQNTAAAEYGNFFNRQLGLTDRQNAFNQNAFESDRQYGTGVYDADRNFSTNRYDTNRNYLTGRADTRTGDLFRLAGLGQGSTNFTNQAGQSYANNVSNQLNTNANNLSNAYGQQANNKVALIGQLTGYAQNAFSNWFPGTSSNPLVNI